MSTPPGERPSYTMAELPRTARARRRRRGWLLLALALLCASALTIAKDRVIGEQGTGLLSYLLVPPLGILGASLCVMGVSSLFKHDLDIHRAVFLTGGVSIVMQLVDIAEQIIYVKLWEYPGIFYLGFTSVLSLALGTYVYQRWGEQTPVSGAVLALVALIGEVLATSLIIPLLGIPAPG